MYPKNTQHFIPEPHPALSKEAWLQIAVASLSQEQGLPQEVILKTIELAKEKVYFSPLVSLVSSEKLMHKCAHEHSESSENEEHIHYCSFIAGWKAYEEFLVLDLRGVGTDAELIVAAKFLGLPFLIDLDRQYPITSGKKVLLQNATPKQLEAWSDWAKLQGITDCFGGDPVYGFVGGYYS